MEEKYQSFLHHRSPCGPCFEFEPSLFEPGVHFYITCTYVGKLPGLKNELQRSMVFETDELKRPKFNCMKFCYFHSSQFELEMFFYKRTEGIKKSQNCI